MADLNQLLTTSGIAELLNVKRETVWDWRILTNKGEGPYRLHPFPEPVTSIGNTLLWDPDQVKAWADATGRTGGGNKGGAGRHTKAYEKA